MTKLAWDEVGKKQYETGVDHGVLYVKGTDGTYPLGVSWSGLTAVTESPSGAESNPQYADNIKYLNLLSAEDVGGTIEAFTYPAAFAVCDGSVALEDGLTITQQPRKAFGFSYRTRIGNDVNASAGYKLHLIYDALAKPTEKAYATVNESPEALGFSWEFTTTPVEIPGGYAPSALLVLDSTKVTSAKMLAIEEILYGSDETPGTIARLPLPAEIITLLSA